MFVDRNGHEAWQYCTICRFHHYDVDTYIQWLLKYRDRGKTFKSSGRKNKAHQQVERWRGIVDRHGTRVQEGLV